MSMRAGAYRSNAAECAKLATTISDPAAKLVLAKIAEAWLHLADYVEGQAEDHSIRDSFPARPGREFAGE
jgi:hypothetical protein